MFSNEVLLYLTMPSAIAVSGPTVRTKARTTPDSPPPDQAR